LLPALTLTLGLLAIATRITRSGMLNELNSKYVQVARLKGVREFNVVTRHALRNSLIPVLTLMGVRIGLYTFRGITSLDYAAVMGVTLVATFIFVMTNLFLDLLYPILDPRIAVWGERR
jgi:peptide/nickel transport system permease protein